MIPPIYADTTLNFFSQIDTDYLYFQSARASLVFLLENINIDVVLIPSYTCPTVIEALKTVDLKYDYVDLEDTLDFCIEDLEYLMDIYRDKKVAILATSLFNAPIRDYKKLYPNAIIIEDLTQSLPLWRQSSDFAIYSFGKSKFLSAFGGGILEGDVDNKRYDMLPIKSTFLKDYILNMVSRVILRYGWSILNIYYQKEKSREYVFEKIEPKRICDLKKKWICSLLKSYNLKHREKISTKYLDMIDIDKQFKLPKNRAYLRMPVKKRVSSDEVSHMEAYRVVYEEAKKKRGRVLQVAECLAYGSTFFPTHSIVDFRDVERFAKLVN